MKILFFILALSVLPSCVNHTTADKIGNNAAYPKSTVKNINTINVNKLEPIQNERDKIDKDQRKELEVQNEKFRQFLMNLKK